MPRYLMQRRVSGMTKADLVWIAILWGSVAINITAFCRQLLTSSANFHDFPAYHLPASQMLHGADPCSTRLSDWCLSIHPRGCCAPSQLPFFRPRLRLGSSFGPMSGVNPIGWTAVMREIEPGRAV